MEVVAENSPAEVEARAWLNDHKRECGLSWPRLADLTGIPVSTLTAFASGTYPGRNDTVAAKVLAYRDRCSAQEQIASVAPTSPDWYETPTAARIHGLLQWAQSGEIVSIITTPGIGKTKVAERFVANDPNAWLATMTPSTAGVATMAIKVGIAIGLGEIKGTPQQLSRQIVTRMKGRRGLLIVDEAQELTDTALNEMRSWHDETRVGLVIMGNESVVGKLNGQKSALAQISSRVSIPYVQMKPEAGDLDVLLDAWGIANPDQRAFLGKIGMLPGALREVTHTIKIAQFAASGAGQELSMAHLRDAARQRHVKLSAL